MKVFRIFCFIVCVAGVKSTTVSGVTSENDAATAEMTTVDNMGGMTNTTDNADLSTPEITTITSNTTNTTNTTTQNRTTPTITDAPTKASTTSHITEASSRATHLPSAPTIPNPTTEPTETSTSPQEQKASQTGTIVGVAFGMLILGAILGVVGVHIFQGYRARGATGYELEHLQKY